MNTEPAAGAAPQRIRDPARRERILAAAAKLIGERGYHAVGLADIGAAAGIVGSGIYRHFDSKIAVLVALLDRVMERLLHATDRIVHEAPDDEAAMAALVRDHIDFALDERLLIQLYQRELLALPDEDRRRLIRVQRLYVEEWVHVLTGLRPGLPDSHARSLAHAAIGAIQSVVWFTSGLPRTEMTELLKRAAFGCLGLPLPDDRPPSSD
ncbi:MAG TPA: TetR/AcrR family transcriptional regulator [Kribbellaceae bacterium]|jgi:AcrR family transcriptional regulator